MNAKYLRPVFPGLAFAAFFLIAFYFVANLDRFRANESSAVGSLRSIYSANSAFARADPHSGYAKTLRDLSRDSAPPRTPILESDWRIDPVLGSGNKAGYTFNYTPHFDAQGKADSYELRADPIGHEKHHFFTNETGLIRISATGPANVNSTPLQ